MGPGIVVVMSWLGTGDFISTSVSGANYGDALLWALLEDPDTVLVTGSWTDIEVSGALVRAARTHRGALPELLEAWDCHTAPEGGLITLLPAPQEQVEARALQIVRVHGLRAMDAWHAAVASLVVPELADGDAYGFASRDKHQAEVAATYGFEIV